MLQQLDYLAFIDIYHERIKAFHVKDAEFRPNGRQGVYGGYRGWVERAGRFRSLGDGQIDFGAIFSKMAQYDFPGWAVLEWECALKHPEDGAREGAEFIRQHIIRVAERAFDDFAGSGVEPRSKARRHLTATIATERGRCTTTAPAGHGRRRTRARSSARCIGSRRGSTIVSNWWRPRCRPIRSARSGECRRGRIARSYADWREMARAEAARDDGIDAVAIVTPNHLHAPVATAFLEAGIHIVCDKPLAISLAEGEALAKLAREKNRLFALTHTYSGYPLVRHARELIESGELGELRVVQVEYAQDWLAEPIETSGTNKQAGWRTDPALAGPAGCLGDIGTHAYHLAAFVTGMTPNTARGGSAYLRAGAPHRRSRAGDAALSEWRARHAMGEPGGERRGKRLAFAGVWDESQPDLRSGASQ